MKKHLLLTTTLLLIASLGLAQLPKIKAETNGEKYKNWGKKPVESTDGPTDMWTMPGQMCDGPSSESVKASTTLSPQGKFKYLAKYVCDDDPTTAWVEGNPDCGIGEFLEFKDWYIMNNTITILNGYQFSKAVWESNSRVKSFKVSLNGKDICVLELADVMGAQTFVMPEKWQSGNFKFTILEVYQGTKYKDTAISGIFTCGG
jgi:hypothetical protein